MRLAKAAVKFDMTQASDAYGVAKFMCQVEPLVYFKVDGVAVKKRMMSCAPDVVMPTRNVILIEGQHYLVGDGTDDFWKGEVIRQNYVIQGADTYCTMNTIAAELASTAGSMAYASLIFAKYLPEGIDSSKFPPQYQILMSGTESAPADSLVKIDTRWFLVKDSYASTSGLRIALANEIQGSVFESVSVGSKIYDPVTDTYASTPITTKIMRVRWQEHFIYLSKAQEDYFRGDETVFILKSAMSPKSSDTLALSDGTWRVLDVQDFGLVWSCHVRR